MPRKPALKVDAEDFERAARVLSAGPFQAVEAKVVTAALRQSGNVVRNSVRKEAAPHRHTGKMRGRVRVKVKGRGLNTEARVSAGGGAAGLIVRGVKPHAISPGRVMPMWDRTGITGFATAVQHPGFPADPFFHRGVSKAMPEVETIIGKGAKDLAADLARAMR